MKKEEKFAQARRVLNTLNFVGSRGKVTLTDVIEYLLENETYEDKKKKSRSIQRVLDILVEEGFLEKHQKSRREGSFFTLASISDKTQTTIKFTGSETLTFYVLKAFLESFRGTSLENDIENLANKISAVAPIDAIPEGVLFWEQLPGMYDFSLKPHIIDYLIRRINDRTWIKIVFVKQSDSKVKTTTVLPQSLYLYDGVLYLIAYNKTAKRNLNYSVYNILSYSDADTISASAPDFDMSEFQKERFAVIDGKIFDVKLQIKPDMAKYFENRKWHISQKTYYDTKQNLIIELKVPIGYDLISWIIKWNEAIKVLEPSELVNQIKKTLKDTLSSYNE